MKRGVQLAEQYGKLCGEGSLFRQKRPSEEKKKGREVLLWRADPKLEVSFRVDRNSNLGKSVSSKSRSRKRP